MCEREPLVYKENTPKFTKPHFFQIFWNIFSLKDILALLCDYVVSVGI